MDRIRPYVLTVAGFDPSGGAGILADIKTFEQNGVYGLAVCSAATLQTEDEFLAVKWTSVDELHAHVRKMLEHYPVVAMKTGIMPSLQTLRDVVIFANEIKPGIKIVVDPIIKSTTGFGFISEIDRINLEVILKNISIITPNYHEAKKLTGLDNIEEAGKYLARFCNVIIKGGHNTVEPGVDVLYKKGKVVKIPAGNANVYPKHGSGCVFSAALTSNLAKGLEIETACRNAKTYTEAFLASNELLLGYHV